MRPPSAMTGAGLALAAAVVLAVLGLRGLAPPAVPDAPAVDRSLVPGPAALAIPSIGVTSGPLVNLGVQADGTMQVPADAPTVGWYGLGPQPGDLGPAVLAAHVDLDGTPGAFTRLAELAPGAEIRVRRADGAEAVFATYRVDRFPKDRFPGEDVYGNTDAPELRLITCGGAFDRRAGHYRDNVVAFARLVPPG
ncbi:MAG: class F sortase [Pseudonocardia sp.]